VPKRIRKGFTLIELMLVITVIGVLVAIAIPVYRDFTVRTKVAELVAAVGPLKTAVAEKALHEGSLETAGVGVTVPVAGRITDGNVTDAGVIRISGDAASVGTAVTIVLTPSFVAGGKLIWTCSTSPDTFKFVPAECRH
jgi:type IV pilus assembly protein PilA